MVIMRRLKYHLQKWINIHLYKFLTHGTMARKRKNELKKKKKEAIELYTVSPFLL